MIMNTLVKLFFENNAFIINSGLSRFKKCIGWLIGLLINSINHMKFHPKLFVVTKYALKNERIKSNMNFFFIINFTTNGSYGFLKGQIEIYFQKSF